VRHVPARANCGIGEAVGIPVVQTLGDRPRFSQVSAPTSSFLPGLRTGANKASRLIGRRIYICFNSPIRSNPWLFLLKALRRNSNRFRKLDHGNTGAASVGSDRHDLNHTQSGRSGSSVDDKFFGNTPATLRLLPVATQSF